VFKKKKGPSKILFEKRGEKRPCIRGGVKRHGVLVQKGGDRKDLVFGLSKEVKPGEELEEAERKAP